MAVRVKRSVSFTLLILSMICIIFVFFSAFLHKPAIENHNFIRSNEFKNDETFQILPASSLKTPTSGVIAEQISLNKTITFVNKKPQETFMLNRSRTKLNSKVHIFYYAWYGSPEIDGQWWHWNHEYIPPWDKHDHHVYPTGAHVPPQDVGANFYPELGPYSSKDTNIIEQHMKMIANSSIGVISLSWYPPGQADEHGPPSDGIVPILLEQALKYGIKICLHVEPYEGRSVANFRKHLRYVHETYGSHPAYYKVKKGSKNVPVFYIYDSYRITPAEWQRLFTSRGDLTVRDSELDALFIGLLVEYKHRFDIKKSGFDGFYTYFASNGFSYGSSWKNWKGLANYAYKNSLIFIPSVGPGYMDTRVRAWNGKNTQPRRNGVYYETAWRTALASPAKYVSITSFNEWHEGTQIEPAIPMQYNNYTYESYLPRSSRFYLELTEKWSNQLLNRTIS